MDWAWLIWLLFSFRGRIQRLYWWLASLVVGAVAGMVSSTIASMAQSYGLGFIDPETKAFEPPALLSILLSAVGVLNVWINYALTAKRLHDRNRSGWWLLAPTVTLVIAIAFAFLTLSLPEGQREPWNTHRHHFRVGDVRARRMARPRDRLPQRHARTEPLWPRPAVTRVRRRGTRRSAMKSIAALLFSFDGRIGRAKFWLGMLVLAAVSFALVRAIIELAGVTDVAVKYAALAATSLLFPTSAVCAKRFHDRDKPGWLALFCLLPSYTASMLQGLGTIDPDDPTPLSVLLNLAVIGVGLVAPRRSRPAQRHARPEPVRPRPGRACPCRCRPGLESREPGP